MSGLRQTFRVRELIAVMEAVEQAWSMCLQQSQVALEIISEIGQESKHV